MGDTIKICYDGATGFVCGRHPKNIAATDSSPFIEASKEEYEMTLECDYGKAWAVIGGKLQMVDDEEAQATSEYAEFSRKNELSALKAYLSETDYVISKLNELKLEDEDEYESEKARYSDTLKRRKEARARINELEG